MMTKRELVDLTAPMPDDAEVVVKFGDIGEGGNVTRPIIQVVDENAFGVSGKSRIVLVTDYCC